MVGERGGGFSLSLSARGGYWRNWFHRWRGDRVEEGRTGRSWGGDTGLEGGYKEEEENDQQ